MPKPSAPPPADLDEVERALSLLEGRHPQHERMRRETLAAAEERRRELERELAVRSRRRIRRGIIVGLNVVALATAGFVAWRIANRARAIRAALDRNEAPFAARGLKETASNELSARNLLEVDLPAASCFVAVSTAGTVRVRTGAMSVEGAGSVGWCACASDHATIENASGGLAVMQIESRRVGGILARPWTDIAPAVWGDSGGECAEATLDDWIADRELHVALPDVEWLDATPERRVLKQAGFRAVAAVEPDRPFGVVDSEAGNCLLAVAGASEELSLRAAGGARRVAHAHGALAWCANVGESTTVWREGKSQVVILSAPAARLGGLLGTRECAEAGGIHVAAEATWLRDEDLAWDATALLRASGLSDVKTAELPLEPGEANARVAALARSRNSVVASAPENVVVVCDPALDAPAERTTLCASAAPVSWWRRGDGAAAMARAPLPFWLTVLETHHEPDAVARIPELLALARNLTRDGFEATVLEGVTELPEGVRVIGRAGEDAVVAVGLTPKPPWAIPYTDGVPWDLGDRPRIVALEPGLAVKLVSSPPPTGPLEQRRTVVFRHAKRL